MQSIQEELIQEIRKTPVSQLRQVLDFLKFLNQQYKQLPTENTQSEVTLAIKDDPTIGLYSGSPDLSERSEDILETEIQPQSGWTWKA